MRTGFGSAVCYTRSMATLTITLDDDVLARLRARAEESSASVEDVAKAYMLASMREDPSVSDEFKAIADEIITKYRPLLHRLAQ